MADDFRVQASFLKNDVRSQSALPAVQKARKVAGEAVGKVHEPQPVLQAMLDGEEPQLHSFEGQRHRAEMLGTGVRPVFLCRRYVLFVPGFFQNGKAQTSQPDTAHKEYHIPFLSHTAAQTARKGFGKFSPCRHANIEQGGARKVAAGNGHVEAFRQGLHAFAESFQPRRILFARQRQADGEARRLRPAGTDVADIHGKGFPAYVEGGEVAAAEMGVFGKDVGRHGQRAAGAEHRAVVPPVEEEAGMPGREIAAHDGKNIVFTGGAHGYSKVR